MLVSRGGYLGSPHRSLFHHSEGIRKDLKADGSRMDGKSLFKMVGYQLDDGSQIFTREKRLFHHFHPLSEVAVWSSRQSSSQIQMMVGVFRTSILRR